MASYCHANGNRYCKSCAKKSQFKPPPNLPQKATKTKICEIAESVGVDVQSKMSKPEIIKQIQNNFALRIIESVSASTISLVEVGKAIREHLDKSEFLSVDKILIENQIGPLAIRMKAIQGMLAQFFIMKGIDEIEFVSSANKLKGLINKKTTYKERKALGIDETRRRIRGDWCTYFETHKKKDDLADCFLQSFCAMK
jgi:hypothetical protein